MREHREGIAIAWKHSPEPVSGSGTGFGAATQLKDAADYLSRGRQRWHRGDRIACEVYRSTTGHSSALLCTFGADGILPLRKGAEGVLVRAEIEV